jgi:hypothetical protein
MKAKEKRLNFPYMKDAPRPAHILSMDEYLEFVSNNVKIFPRRSLKEKNKVSPPLSVRFRII